MHDPDLIILDEPTSGLDPNQIAEIRSLIREFGREKTLILSTHILPEVTATCDRVIIINKGKIVADGSPDELVPAGREGDVELFKLQTEKNSDPRLDLYRLAAEKEWPLAELHLELSTLEDIFRKLTIGEEPVPGAGGSV